MVLAVKATWLKGYKGHAGDSNTVFRKQAKGQKNYVMFSCLWGRESLMELLLLESCFQMMSETQSGRAELEKGGPNDR